MGKLEVRGDAERTVEYDLMKITISFRAGGERTDEASGKVMKECETFLAQMKKRGYDISSIALNNDDVSKMIRYGNDNLPVEYTTAERTLELICKFNMKLINELRSILNNLNPKIGFRVSYMLSGENAIKQDLLMEALKDAKNQADKLAGAIDQKVKGLISADKNELKPDVVYGGQVLCMTSVRSAEPNEYFPNSDELVATTTTLKEHIYTVWEIE